jgi:hypothetical protein
MNLKNKKPFLVFGLISAIISLLLGIAITASAQSGNSGESYHQLVITEIYAKHYRITTDEALHRLKLQDSFPGLSTELENNEKETFGGLWIQHEPEYKIVVAFTNNGDKTISEYSKYISEEVASYIEIRTVSKSLVELLNDQDKLLLSLSEQGLKADSRVDIINNCVSIDIAKVDENLFNIAKQNDKLAIPDGLKIKFVDGLSMLATNIYGGLTLNYYSWGAPFCTSGFSVINSAGTKTIATAGHAGSGSMYFGSTSLPFLLGVTGGSYDCELRGCPGLTVTNKIQWWSDGSTFDITSKKTRSEQHVGDVVSKYGYNTYYTAGQITSTSAMQPAPYNDATWIEVYNIFGYSQIAGPGDSGGPWFSGNTALGITHSVSADWQTAWYMSQDYLSIMGVSVMTSP